MPFAPIGALSATRSELPAHSDVAVRAVAIVIVVVVLHSTSTDVFGGCFRFLPNAEGSWEFGCQVLLYEYTGQLSTLPPHLGGAQDIGCTISRSVTREIGVVAKDSSVSATDGEWIFV